MREAGGQKTSTALRGARCGVLLLMLQVAAMAAAQQAPGVRLETVSREAIIQEVSLNGTVNPLRVSSISPAVAGLLDSVRVETGDRVARDDVLVELDDEQAVYELAAARAESDQARAFLAEAERRLREARSVGAGRNIAATEVRSRESEVVAARAALARLHAVLNQMEVRVRRHHVRAPFDGVISERSSDLGEWVTPGDELLRLVDTTNLRLDFQVPQDYFNRLDERSQLLVRQGSDLAQATINVRVPVTDPQSRTFLLRALQPEGAGFWPGMAVQAVLRVSTGKEGLTVSRDAINRYPEGRVTVWIARAAEGGTYTVSEKRIRLGTAFKGRVEVTDGLSGGEQVVVRGNESLSEGITVRIAEREAR
ncbi:efflux RND transporter periplasmic adaptor subunit [Marinobacter sp. M216]|uniref:Efflux RND transporter periplasmic adaptor subunit n=1 Tax=Marinobacter albus TaxID=3030833 RepID=A0ABT7HEN7_9GAMM|nr:efflux RND transporter periplasmic adaptor subunit [Marinobacter sp. M216]MDK9558492.1 efflux RND transporter periplasmic adaptor subunit [Marinobacter sp. M216]